MKPEQEEAEKPSSPKDSRWSLAANICIVILTVIAALAVAYVMRPLLFPIVLATIVAAALKPIGRKLCSSRLRLPPPMASVIIVGSLIGLGLLTIYSLQGPATKWIKDAPKQFREIERKIQPVKESVDEISKAANQIEEVKDKVTSTVESDEKVKVEVARPTMTAAVLSMTTEVLLEIGITLAFLFFLLAYGDDFVSHLSRLPAIRKSTIDLSELVFSVEQKVSNYLLTFSAINACLGTVIGLGLWAIGMPNPLLWGVMAACLNFIPYLGLLTGTSIVTFVAIVTFDSLLYATLAPLIYLTANLLEANVMTPYLLGRQMRIHVIILFLGILLMGWLWGIGGVLIAVPLLASIRVILDHIDFLKPLGEFLDHGESEE